MKQILFFILLGSATFLKAQIYFADEGSNIGFEDDCGYADLGNGVSFVDYDDDGWDDITLPSSDSQPLRFYKNYQGVFFKELLITPPIMYQTRSVTWVDFDNDGDKDLFITSDTNGNRLYENHNNELSDISVQAGFPLVNYKTYGASWGDINNDGCLDVFISNREEDETSIITNYMYQNNCDGTFTNVTDSIGLTNVAAPTFCSGFLDINNDGWQDIYVSNDKYAPNFLYKNNGDGTFTDISAASGTNIIADAMCVTVDDYNSDGFLDIYVTNTPAALSTPSEGSYLFKNNGNDTFEDVTVASGTRLDSFSWGSVFLDAENDGDLDLYVSCSFDGTYAGYASSAFYENQSNGSFTQPVNIGFNNDTRYSHGSAIGDLNNDGRVDIVVMNNDDQLPFIWNNQTTSSNNYLGIKLRGTTSNKDGIGSLIEISINNEKQYRYVMCGEGYASQNSLKEIFGLGASQNVDYVKVKWLSGIEDILYNVNGNQVITIEENSTLSVDEFTRIDRIRIFPNPTYNLINLNSNVRINNIILHDILGQHIKKYLVNAKKYALDIESLSKGVYFLTVTISNNNIETHRIVKH